MSSEPDFAELLKGVQGDSSPTNQPLVLSYQKIDPTMSKMCAVSGIRACHPKMS
jgi:hypothetical protein